MKLYYVETEDGNRVSNAYTDKIKMLEACRQGLIEAYSEYDAFDYDGKLIMDNENNFSIRVKQKGKSDFFKKYHIVELDVMA